MDEINAMTRCQGPRSPTPNLDSFKNGVLAEKQITAGDETPNDVAKNDDLGVLKSRLLLMSCPLATDNTSADMVVSYAALDVYALELSDQSDADRLS